jgi:flagellar protein FlaG
MADISSVANRFPDVAQVQEVQSGRHIARGREQNFAQEGRPGSDSEKNVRGSEQLIQQINEMGTEELDSLRKNINSALEPINVKLNFDEHEETGRIVVTVVNSETEEVIRQIPPEAILKMAQRMEEMTGLLLDIWR